MPANPNDIDNSNLVTNYDGTVSTYYPDGNKPDNPIFSDINYPPIPSSEPPIADRRCWGGAGADDANDGILVADGGTGPWATWDKVMQELCASSTWYGLKICGDVTISAVTDTKFLGSGPGSLEQFVQIYGDPDLPSPPTVTVNARQEIDGQSYWLWHSFNMAGTDGFNFAEDLVMSRQTQRNITGNMTGNGGDNHAFFQCLNKNLTYWGVFNCDFEGPGIGGSVNGNTACLLAFACRILRWENNRLTNAPRPAYQKHSNIASEGAADIYIANNYFPLTHGAENSFFAGRKQGGTYDVDNNIFECIVEISNGGGGEQPDGIEFKHNTCRGDVRVEDGNDPAINGIYENNIIESLSAGAGDFELLRFQTTNANTNTSDYNLYGGSIYYQNTQYTLAGWQAASVPANQDVNSIAGAPTYTGGANPTTVAGFALTTLSNGYQAANDGSDMGADVTKVGNM